VARLTDVELRYRQRYVDLVANPPCRTSFAREATIVRAVRAILDAKGFLEVETPTMHTLIGGASARPFLTQHNALDMRLHAHRAGASLERLVVGGLERVYEIGRCYRTRDEHPPQPDFTILEYYQATRPNEDLMDFTEVLLRGVDASSREPCRPRSASGRVRVPYDGRALRACSDETAVARAAERTGDSRMDRRRRRQGGHALVGLLGQTFVDRIKEWAKASLAPRPSTGRTFAKDSPSARRTASGSIACYEYVVEPFLTEDYRSADGKLSVPVSSRTTPFEVSPWPGATTRARDDDRFRVFVNGRELGNGFSELKTLTTGRPLPPSRAEKKARGEEDAMD